MAHTINRTAFEAHLRSLDPSQTYVIEHLFSGRNITVRATRQKQSTVGCARWQNHPNLVLKYAPPWVVTTGTTTTSTEARQTVEALALGLFGDGGGLISHIAPGCGVHVPQLLHHDANAHILIMSDLGPGKPLSEILAEISENPNNLDRYPGLLPHFVKLGEQIGSFFAKLHSSSTADLLLQRHIRNPSAQKMIAKGNVHPVMGFLDRSGISDSEKLACRVLDDFLNSDATARINSMPMFSFGDARTKSIYLTPIPGENVGDTMTYATGLIDWEFAEMPGRGPNGDMAMLLADLNSYIIENEGKYICEKILLLIYGITNSYRDMSEALGAPWVLPSGLRPKSIAQYDLEAAQPFIESAFILHGRELVIGAFYRNYDCSCCGKGERTDKCVVRQRIVEKGCWYLGDITGRGRSKLEAHVFDIHKMTEYVFDWERFDSEQWLILQGLFSGTVVDPPYTHEF